jgi:hypothetical protein
MMSKITVAVFIAFAIDGRAFGQSNEAWWLTVRFQPRDATVEGIPIQQIDPSWTAASLLRDAPLPAAASERGYTLQDYGATFERSGNFDRDSREDKVLVGVYKTRTGVSGRFLLVLSSRLGGGWVKRVLFKERGEAGFSAILGTQKRLVWATCMACDSFCEVIPRRGSWKLKCESQ